MGRIGRFSIVSLFIFLAGFLSTAQDVTIHSGTSVVLVPTLVTNIAGEPIFRLSAEDFAVYDNGVQQKIQLDENVWGERMSVVVAIQKGHSADGTLDKVKKLGSLLYPIAGEGKGEVAVVAFDGKPELKHDFTTDLDQVNKAISQIAPGSYSCSVLDAIAYSIALLDARPSTNRKVLFLPLTASSSGGKIRSSSITAG